MRRISDLFAKFSHLAPPEGAIKEVVQSSIADVVGIKLTQKEIQVSKEKVHLRVDSVRRSEVMLAKAAILRKIAERLPGKRVIREIL